MKQLKFFFVILLMGVHTIGVAQKNKPAVQEKKTAVRQLTIEPGIGIHTNFGTDLLLANLVQWNPSRRLSLASHTSFNINNVFQRDFNGIKTKYNHSINQKIGIGTTFYSKKSSNTFLLMAGIKYTAFEETLNDPAYAKVSTAVSAFSPDYGLLYNLKKGVKKYFFSFRAYVPLYPWPSKDFDISYTDGNMNNIALEFGVGIKLK